MGRQGQIISFVHDKLKLQPSWLLIYDNMTKIQDCLRYLPDASAARGIGKVIFTTQDSNIVHNPYIHDVIHIGELSPTQKQELFFKVLDDRDFSVKKSKNSLEITRFLEAIPPFPLDVSVAASYIASTNISIGQYLEYLNANTHYFNAVQKSILQENAGYYGTRYTIVAKSLDQLIDTKQHFIPLLLTISLLDSQNIPKAMLDKIQDSVTVDDFIYNLKKYSFITGEMPSDLGYTFAIHTSTRANMLSYLVQKLDFTQKQKLLESIVRSFGSYIDNVIETEDLNSMKLLLPHCEALIHNNKTLLTDEIVGYIEGKLGSMYYYLSYNSEAENILKTSLSKLKNHYDLYYEEIAKNLLYLGLSSIYTQHDNDIRAETLLKQSLTVYRKHFDKDNPKIADILINLGHIEVKRNNFVAATKLLEDGLKIYMTDQEKYCFRIAWTLKHLGNMYREIGNYKKAQKYLTESIAIYEQHVPIHESKMYTTYVYLGETYRDLGRYDKSKLLLEKAGDFTNSYYGERRPWSLVHLGITYQNLGEYKKAQILLDKSLSHYKKYFLPNHTKVIWSSVSLGNLYNSLGYYDKALTLVQHSFDAQKKHVPKDSSTAAEISIHLGSIYTNLSEYSKSTDLLEQGLAIYSKYFAKDHIQIGFILSLMGKNYMLSGNYSKAKELLERSLVIHETHFGKNHIETARVIANLGNNELINGNLNSAETLLDRALKIFEASNHPDIYAVLEILAELNLKKAAPLQSSGHNQDAQKLRNLSIAQLQQALSTIEACFPDAGAHSAITTRIKSKLDKYSQEAKEKYFTGSP